MKKQIIFCYDAYCGWSYAFAETILHFAEKYKDEFDVDVFSGGLILPERRKHISVLAAYFLKNNQEVNAKSGISFGTDFLWHIENPDLSDWFPDSLKPAIALAVFRELYPDRQVEFATDLSKALFAEGRDLCDNEAYRHLLEKYAIAEEKLYAALGSDTYAEAAREDFSAVKALGVSGFPSLLVQVDAKKFVRLCEGWISAEELEERMQAALASRENQTASGQA
jgi:putative protein-disulfide isomerase